MNYPTLLARLCAAVVLIAPLSLLGASNEETVKKLGLTRFVEPMFPDGLRFEGVSEGYATLAVSRDAAGEPGDILVLAASHRKFADAAVEALREWRFAPVDSAAALVPHIVRVGFKLEGLVIVYPLAKSPDAMLAGALNRVRPDDPVRIPSLQALAQVPKALAQPMPAYPSSLVSRKLEGTAAVLFYVDEEGRIRLPQITEASSPEFADAALAAVSQWRYEPPQAGGRSIVVSDHWTFQFKANN